MLVVPLFTMKLTVRPSGLHAGSLALCELVRRVGSPRASRNQIDPLPAVRTVTAIRVPSRDNTGELNAARHVGSTGVCTPSRVTQTSSRNPEPRSSP